jgi:hypothetical protein
MNAESKASFTGTFFQQHAAATLFHEAFGPAKSNWIHQSHSKKIAP